MTAVDPPDITQFLIEHTPYRFQLTGPAEFEWLVRELFVRDGYTLISDEIPREAVAYFIAEKQGDTMVILPELAVPGHAPSPGVLDQAVRLRDVYQADYVFVITTGDLPADLRKQARKLGVEAWDWAKLAAAISALFFNGEEIPAHQPVSAVPTDGEEEVDPGLHLAAKWAAREGVPREYFNLELSVTNLSNRHRYLHFDLPVIVDIRGRQIAGGEWPDGEFTAGMIYSGATVSTNALFPVERTGDKPPGGRVMLSCHERLDLPVTYHLSGRLKGEACFAVTYCFGRESADYVFMTAFRDEVLMKRRVGRWLVESYYAVSPGLIDWVRDHPVREAALRWLVRMMVRLVTAMYGKFKP